MKLATLALALGLASPAFAAAPLSVDFEQNWIYGTEVAHTYAGVTFTNVLGLSNGDGLGNLANGDYYVGAPSPQGVAVVQLDGIVNTTAYMNVAGGVTGGLSFFYSSANAAPVVITAYSGLNGTGTALQSITLNANSPDYTSWSHAVLSFGGTAQSFDLSSANGVGLDNITAVPEPASLALMLAGATVLLARRRRG